MPNKLSNAEAVSRIHAKVGDEYSVLSEYKGSDYKIKIKHNKCGNEFYMKYANFYNQGQRCPRCQEKVRQNKVAESLRKRRMTDTEFTHRINDLVGDEYTFIEKYTSSKTKMRVVHNTCGNQYLVTPSDFLSGRRCPKCQRIARGKHRAKTNLEFVNEVFEQVGNEYTFLEDYARWDIKIKVRHNTCGYEYYVQPNAFTQGHRCPQCVRKRLNQNLSSNNTEFDEKLKKVFGTEYTRIGQYVNNSTKIEFKHNTCQRHWKTRPANLLFGFGCPYCKSSKGERNIASCLKELHIKYEPQKHFPDLKAHNTLSYDYYIDSLRVLIEFQGEQHYFPVKIYGGLPSFKKQLFHDALKQEYADKNGYTLIKIPYILDTRKKVMSLLNSIFKSKAEGLTPKSKPKI